MKLLFAACLFLLNYQSKAQMFYNANTIAGINYTTEFTNAGHGVTVYDLNKDGWDDIIFASANQPIYAYINNFGTFYQEEIIPNTLDIKQVICFDFDNDGDADIFLNAYEGKLQLYQNNGNLEFQNITLQSGLQIPNDVFGFGAAVGDYNNDGWLDIYATIRNNSDQNNFFFQNNGDGTFTEKLILLNIDVAMSFMPAFIDYNNDGFQDIYVMVDDGLGDALFKNNGDNTFTNVALQAGLTVSSSSMSIGACDYNKDGYEDIYISNHEAGNILYSNNGDGTFTNLAEELGSSINSFCWGTVWMDANNDRNWDLYVGTDTPVNNAIYSDNQDIFLMQENGYFNSVPFISPAESYVTYGAARGDFNNDGKSDFVITTGDTEYAQVYYNSMYTENHYLKLTLEGVASNRDAVGTRIEAWAGGTATYHYLKQGEGYLAQFSQHTIIPLGQFSQLDSLKLHWLSGWVDTYYNLPANQSIFLTEGGSLASVPLSVAAPIIHLCEGDSLELSALGNWQSIVWNNQSINATLDVSQGGSYWAQVTHASGLVFNTDTVLVSYNTPPAYNVNFSEPTCFGAANGSLFIGVLKENNLSIIWESDWTGFTLQDLAAGEYSFAIIDSSNCVFANSFLLTQPPPLHFSWNNELVACNGEDVNVEILVANAQGNYTLDWHGYNPNELYAGQYLLSAIDENNCTADTTIEILQYDPINIIWTAPLACYNETSAVSVIVNGGAGAYTFNWQGENPNALYAGDYNLIVTDQANCQASEIISIIESTEILVMPAVINANDGDNGSIELTVAGGYTPYTYSWQNSSNDDNILENVGQNTYTCTVTDALLCSVIVEVPVLDIGIQESLNEISLYPNPFNNVLQLNFSHPQSFKVYNALGALILIYNSPDTHILLYTTNWCSGVYLIKSDFFTIRAIKQE